jgi:NADPH:quinone reductase-like Zn-dependent oxidoreductase
MSSEQKMMQVVRFHEYGGPEVLLLEQIPVPQPEAGQVLVRVHATGLNPMDWKLREGYLKAFRPLEFPFTPGVDIAGVIAAVGSDVTDWQVGEAVFGRGSNGYAEYALMPANALVRKPASLSFAEAASIPVAALTAWQALFEQGGLEAGQRVLIQAAAGGVGGYAVQFARHKGASEVIGTASSENIEYVMSLGAHAVIDYRTTAFQDALKNIDLVVDGVGGEVQDQSFKVMRPGGVLVSIVKPPSAELLVEYKVRGLFFSMNYKQAQLQEITELIVAGEIKTEVGTIFPLSAAREAQILSQNGHVHGKIVLHVAD